MVFDFKIPSEFCGYTLVEKLGSGGQASVYKARDISLDRMIALKTIFHSSLIDNPEVYEIFQREARLAASLNHRNIVHINKFSECDGVPFIDMDLLPGSLADHIDKIGRIEFQRAVDIALQVCSALSHAQPFMVHRDIKPENILIDEGGVVKVSDFGLARMLTDASVAYQSNTGNGTYAYMAPELWETNEITKSVDIYALGVTLFEMIAGKLPFEGPTSSMFQEQHRNAEVPSFPEDIKIPPVILGVVKKAMAKSPQQRYLNAQEMANALGDAIEARPDQRISNVPTESSPEIDTSMRPVRGISNVSTESSPEIDTSMRPVRGISNVSTEIDISLEMEQEINPESPNIKVIGVGGGGSNAVSRMFKDRLSEVEYFSVNTDSQHLSRCDVSHRLAIGQNLTRGLGSGANPNMGREAAEESRHDIKKALEGTDMVFLVAGMGGGTGTGASPVIAQIAKESGALTVAVVSKPFSFEASMRKKNADEGIALLKDNVDTLIVIDNDRLLQLNTQGEKPYTWEDALKISDWVLKQGIQAILEVVTVPGEINVDFADVRTIFNNAGPAWLAIGRAKGENRAVHAARQVTESPLSDISMDGAKRIMFVISGGPTLTLQEVQDSARVIQDMSDPDANIIFGTCRDAQLDDEVKIIMVAASIPL